MTTYLPVGSVPSPTLWGPLFGVRPMADSDNHYVHMHARYTHNADGTITRTMVPVGSTYRALSPNALGSGQAASDADSMVKRPRRLMDMADDQS